MQPHDPVAAHMPSYAQPHPQPQDGTSRQPQPVAPRKPANGAPGVIAIVLSVLAAGPLGLALLNLEHSNRLALNTELPRWIRGVAIDANLNRVLVFGGVAGALALLALLLGLVARKAKVGKIAIVLAGMVVAGTVFAEVGRSTFDKNLAPGKDEQSDADERSHGRRAPRLAEAPVADPLIAPPTATVPPGTGAHPAAARPPAAVRPPAAAPPPSPPPPAAAAPAAPKNQPPRRGDRDAEVY